jgi:hypothetical protein
VIYATTTVEDTDVTVYYIPSMYNSTLEEVPVKPVPIIEIVH